MVTARRSPGMGGCSRRGLSQRREREKEEMRPRGRLGEHRKKPQKSFNKQSGKVNILTATWEDYGFLFCSQPGCDITK